MSGVSIITSTIRQHNINNVFINYISQDYKNKELIVILNKNDMDISLWKKTASKYNNIRIFRLDESKSLGECLNFAIGKAEFPYIAKLDDDDYYAPHYISNSMKYFDTTDAAIVGKLTYFVYLEGSNTLGIRYYGNENKFVNIVSGATMIIKKKVFDKILFNNEHAGSDTEFLKDCVHYGFKIYSGDRYNFTLIRHPDLSHHTWKITKKDILKKCKFITKTDNYKKYVVK